MAAGLGSLTDYLGSLGSAVPDVAGAAGAAGSLGSLTGLGSLLGMSNPITAIPSLAMMGLNLAGINPIGDLLSSLQGLPANAKPQMFANYLQQQGGLPSDLGSLINAAQQQAGGNTGLLSMSGAGAFNPNFMATLLEALTGQNLGAVDPTTGRQTFTAPATGQVKNPVSLSFLGEQQLMQSPGMQGLQAYGYTPQQLASPAAQKAIEQATNYGMVGTGQGLGTQKVAQYLPKVVAALQAAGIQPGAGGTSAAGVGSASDYTSQTPQGDTSTGTSTSDGTLKASDLTNLLQLLGSGGNITLTGPNNQTLELPSSSLSKLLNPSGVTQIANPTQLQQADPTINVNLPQTPASAKFSQGYTGLGFARPEQLPTITPMLNLSGVGG